MAYRNCDVLFNAAHVVDVSYKNGSCASRNVLFVVTDKESNMQIKLRDVSEFSFNYTTTIDFMAFDKMKREQCLEINFEEFHMQIVELLKLAVSKEMLLRLEADDINCKVVFYERSRIKSLIFLTVDLVLTNQKEIIDEMSINILNLKNANNQVNHQLLVSKNQMQEKDLLLKSAVLRTQELEQKYCKDLELVEQIFSRSINTLERSLSERIQKLNIKHLRLLCNLECVKRDSFKKADCSTRLIQSMQNLRFENEKHYKTAHDLQMEVQNLSIMKSNSEKNCNELKQSLSQKDQDINELHKQIAELRKDIHEATIIIAQKTKTHDEIAKDLVQANTMLVNFNNHYDVMSKEVDQMKDIVRNKEKVIKEQIVKITSMSEEFEAYKGHYNAHEMKALNTDLLQARQRVEELEKHNREINKLNGILTKKLASADFHETRSTSWLPHK